MNSKSLYQERDKTIMLINTNSMDNKINKIIEVLAQISTMQKLFHKQNSKIKILKIKEQQQFHGSVALKIMDLRKLMSR